MLVFAIVLLSFQARPSVSNVAACFTFIFAVR